MVANWMYSRRSGLPGLLVFALAAAISGCAATPAAESRLQPAEAALADQSGLVIGTLSYQYADTEAVAGRGDTWQVHFERIDHPAARQAYALAVSVDAETQAGIFTGALPAGVYAFREAASAHKRFASGRMSVPFEVQAGQVRDVGHYAVSAAMSP